MPFLELITNVTLTRAQTEELALSLSAHAAETLQKPESAFGINVRANEVLTFAGNWDPCTLPLLQTLSDESQPPRDWLRSIQALQLQITNRDFGFCVGFQLRITSLNNLQPDKNIGYSKAFSTFLKEKIGVENDRGYIIFYDPGKLNVLLTGLSFLSSCLNSFVSRNWRLRRLKRLCLGQVRALVLTIIQPIRILGSREQLMPRSGKARSVL